MILDFLNEQLPWRNCKDNKVDDVRDVKIKCFKEPEKYIWTSTTSKMSEVRNIYYTLYNLKYEDRPDYNYVRLQLMSLLNKEEVKERTLDTRTSSTVYNREFTLV